MLPTVPFGPHRVTRLVIGGNPFSGGSHFSPELDRAFLDYYTTDNIKRALFECERCGLNTMQSRGDRHIRRMIREYRSEGGTLQWIAQTASELADQHGHIRQLAGEAVGVYLHGTRTDALWLDGRIDEAREYLKVIRDAGVVVGLGTHRPEVIEHAEERGWDLGFYMASLYTPSPKTGDSHRFRPPSLTSPVAFGVTKSVAVPGFRPQTNEHFDDSDRDRMTTAIRATPKTCLAFKILAANRKCATEADVRQAFEYAFANIKPIDAVVVGMYQEHANQVAMNVAIVAELCARGAGPGTDRPLRLGQSPGPSLP
jgi:hypothetical protein